ncbi:Asp-tRNA(Asn)/Glu-tRNA(Gln) amidotransferase subunit GatB [Candidatus Parcubacteria bacterium]|nr:MAG: Asp-tRNA(Asn)/Glu-tRNA(Gln) amidotransferase subunit GatB [Candidatus Parcubacteria bacterium]
MKLEPIIGLEIHVQLKTESKMFCSCDNSGEDKPANTTICPVCTGHPGTLPAANLQAVKWSVMAAAALNCEIPTFTKFDRKHYFYPDLPKGYQISQYDKPIGIKGYLDIESDQAGTKKGKRRINITRLHLEEDAAKNFHSPDGRETYVDYNRAGTPLMEIVTEPDLRSSEEAKTFMQELRLIMRYLNISDADMEKGHLRCDANISLSQTDGNKNGSKKLNPKTEIKNINSFNAVKRALDYEISRQTKLWQEGNPPKVQSTRGWDEDKGMTEEQRTKEEAQDYRYFPEPDLPPIKFYETDSAIDVEKIKRELPESPQQKRKRFSEQYEMPADQARIITEDKLLASYTEAVISELTSWLADSGEMEGTAEEIWEKNKGKISKLAAKWITNRLLFYLNRDNIKISDCKISAENFAEFITIVYGNRINQTTAMKILDEMYQTGKDPSDVMEENDFAQIDDLAKIKEAVKKAIDANPLQVKQFKAGKVTIIQYLIGQVMKETKGKANPKIVRELLEEELKSAD